MKFSRRSRCFFTGVKGRGQNKLSGIEHNSVVKIESNKQLLVEMLKSASFNTGKDGKDAI